MEEYIDLFKSFVYSPIGFFVYIIVNFFKKTVLVKRPNSIINNAIPEIAALVGAGLAVCMELIWPDVMPSTDMVNAITTGLASGFAATGVDQAIKHYKKAKNIE